MTPAAPRIPFADLSWQWRVIEPGITPEMRELFEASAFCLGPAVENFEDNFAAYVGARHAVGVSSGTAALHLAVLAAGIGPGDKVLLPINQPVTAGQTRRRSARTVSRRATPSPALDAPR